MRVGIITDIHNNCTALEAVLRYLDAEKCEKIICCGDIIGIGPYPEETVQRMMQIPDLIAVRGNHEKYLLEGMPETYPNDQGMSDSEMEHHKWEHNRLSAVSKDFLESLPYSVDVTIDGVKISVMHYCMDEKHNYINYTADPAAKQLSKMFSDTESDVIFYGHDHSRTICKADKYYVNVGSLGCPARDKNIARFGIMEISDGDVTVKPVEITYPAETVVEDITRFDYPDADAIKKYFYGIE